MKPHRALLLLIGSCVLSLVGWTSNADALPTLTITDELNHTATLGFTSVASGTFGCVSGYTCFKMTDFLTTGGTPATRTLSYVTTSGTPVASSAVGVPANTWLQITTGGNFT